MKIRKVKVIKLDDYGAPCKILVNDKHRASIRSKLTSTTRIFIVKGQIIKVDSYAPEYQDASPYDPWNTSKYYQLIDELRMKFGLKINAYDHLVQDAIDERLCGIQGQRTIKLWKKVKKTKNKRFFQALTAYGKTECGRIWIAQRYSPLEHKMKYEQWKKLKKVVDKYHLWDVCGPYDEYDGDSTINCAVRKTDRKAIIYDYAL